MKITKEYIEGLGKMLENLKDSNQSANVNYLIGYLQGLINLYEAENEQN